jgi:PrtD family type I secretion system ABC transporter
MNNKSDKHKRSLDAQKDPRFLKDLFFRFRFSIWIVVFLSFGVNILMFTGPLYMLQVYDRVLASRSLPTLVVLSGLLIFLLAFQGFLDTIRSRIVVRVASLLDEYLAGPVARAVMIIGQVRRDASATAPLRDLDQVRAFLAGQGPISMVDLPWLPIFVLACWLIHPWLGWLALAGAALLFGITLTMELVSRRPGKALADAAVPRLQLMEQARRNESIMAMGMAGSIERRFVQRNNKYIDAMRSSADVTNGFGNLTKALRFFLQSAALGLGAWLVIRHELTPGGMIAASILLGRALAPVETAIANWRNFVAARESAIRLREALSRTAPLGEITTLPDPCREITLAGVVVVPPGGQTPLLSNITFHVKAGEALAIIGPSAAGKTSLVRTVVGLWPAGRGTVRIDGAALAQWDPDQLGRHIGYLSQEIELFDGTVAENIARMSVEVDSQKVVRAAVAAGAHDMIQLLPDGYDTRIGDGGITLSGGQRQRVGLARALYGEPFLVVLDEPNSNLDADGEQALSKAVLDIKARGGAVILIAHRPSTIAVCENVLLVMNGSQQGFGPRNEILSRIMPPASPQPTPPSKATDAT